MTTITTRGTRAHAKEITALSSGKFVATDTGLVVIENPTFDEWMAYGKLLQRINRALQMIIGDWLNEGERRYGETYAQATVLFPDAQMDTLKNWKYVAGRVEKSLRDDELHYSHYAAVAPLPEPERADWLVTAKVERLSSRDLREAIREAHDPLGPAPAPLRDALLVVATALIDISQRRDIPKIVIPILGAVLTGMDAVLAALEGEKERTI